MPSFMTYIDGGELGEIRVSVDFDYQPPEPQTWSDPGVREYADVTEVRIVHSGSEFPWPVALPFKTKLMLDQEALEWLHDDEMDAA